MTATAVRQECFYLHCPYAARYEGAITHRLGGYVFSVTRYACHHHAALVSGGAK